MEKNTFGMLNSQLNSPKYLGVSHLLLMFCLSLIATGSFASAIEKVSLAEQQLEMWVDKKLTREVLARLKRSSFYVNKPLLLVVVKDGKVQGQVDKLHAFVKQRLSEKLLRNNVNIIDSTHHPILTHHRQPSSLSCDPHNGVRAYLELELQLQRSNKIKAKFRFVDAYGQHKASPPFEFPSRIKLWRYKAKDWQQMSVDEGLRGLRHLPFTIDQPDLMAKYLADNLSCLLRLKLGASLKLAVDRPVLESPLDTVVANLSSYMAQNDEVTMHRTQEQANYVIRVEAHLIDQWDRLYQVNATVEDLRTQEILGGVPTSSYMSMKNVEPMNDTVFGKQQALYEAHTVYKPASETHVKPVSEKVTNYETISIKHTPLISVGASNKALSIECVRYVDGTRCNGPFKRLDKPWMVQFKIDSRYRGAMVIASLVDEIGNDFRQITGRCAVSTDGNCDIKFLSEAGLYKGGFAIEARIYQGDAAHPVIKDNYFKRTYYVK